MKLRYRFLVFLTFFCFFTLYSNAQEKLVEHEIQPNETLESIADLYGLSVETLKELNPDNYKFVYAGFTLKIPAEAKKKAEQKKEEAKRTAEKVSTSTKTSTNPPSTTPPTNAERAVDKSSTASGFNVMKHSGNNLNPDETKTRTSRGHYGEVEVYRRSSLCILMLTHRGKEYAEEMESVFKNMVLPLRYNRHDIDVKVIPVDRHMNESSIANMLSDKGIAKQIVAKWFNRNKYSGNMDMNLIWERGGYNASYEDYKRAQNTERGTATLTDEGIELLQNTFVLVCDMEYYNKERTGKGLAIAGALLSAGLGAYANVQASRGKTEAAGAAYAGSQLASVGSVVASDMGGFSVSMNAYLYRLDWTDKSWASICNDYWVDATTDYSTKQDRKKKFDNDNRTFNLEFIGKYHEKSGKTVLKSKSDLNNVIRNVCSTTIKKGMKELAKSYPIFRPRAPFYFDNNTMFCRIGSKEDVTSGIKCEIVEPIKKNGMYYYNVIGTAMPFNVWNNHDIRFDQYFDPNMKGTPFRLLDCKGDIHQPGLLIRIL